MSGYGDVPAPSTADEDEEERPPMSQQRSGWRGLRHRRMAEPGAAEAYDAAWPAFDLGRRIRVQLP